MNNPDLPAPKFSIGDLVQLRSGSPTLTVESARHGNLVSVVWFVAGMAHRDRFEEEALQAVAPVADPVGPAKSAQIIDRRAYGGWGGL